MREIKFRIWNKGGNNMLYDIDNVLECLKQQIKFDNSMPDRGFVVGYDHRSDGMVWQQFTGLKDKNGKEVYEGDILMHKGAKGIVIYENSNAMFMVRFPLLRSVYSFDSIEGEIEIIGNIHENPELLK